MKLDCGESRHFCDRRRPVSASFWQRLNGCLA